MDSSPVLKKRRAFRACWIEGTELSITRKRVIGAGGIGAEQIKDRQQHASTGQEQDTLHISAH